MLLTCAVRVTGSARMPLITPAAVPSAMVGISVNPLARAASTAFDRFAALPSTVMEPSLAVPYQNSETSPRAAVLLGFSMAARPESPLHQGTQPLTKRSG